MKIALCQLDSAWENRQESQQRITAMLDQWPVSADLLVFPEMTLSGFSMDSNKTALDASDMSYFEEIARQRACHVLFGGVEHQRNCIFLTDGSSTKRVYEKNHLFSYGGEAAVYEAGQDSAIVTIGGVRMALAICYDLRFSYHFWNLAPQVDAFVVIANWPTSRKSHWRLLLEARAIENQAYVIGVNRTGDDPKLSYPGESAVYGPFGDQVLRCGAESGAYVVDIRPELVAETRAKYQFLKDRKA